MSSAVPRSHTGVQPALWQIHQRRGDQRRRRHEAKRQTSARRLAADAADEPARYGFGVGGFLNSFISGDSGPVTPVSETRYSDTFGTGYGLRLEGYRSHGDGLRSQVGLVYASWSGKSFAGGEFPSGAQFGRFQPRGAVRRRPHRVGIARSIGGGRSMTLDVRLQAFGKPEAAIYPIAAATGGSALMIAFGYEWEARR